MAASGCGDDPDADFTEEELRLEREVEQALNELEAVDAAVTALRQQFENASEEADESKRELEKLRAVADNWREAAEEGRRELAERERRVQELLDTLAEQQAEDEAAGEAAAEVARREHREALEARQLDVAAKRVLTVESQVERLEEQVTAEADACVARQEERKDLERQAGSVERDRDAQLKAQRDAKAALQAAEEQLKAQEEVVAAGAKRQQAMSRQVVQLTGTRNGLRARRGGATALAPAAPAPQPPSEARTLSLRLQWEVVGLWEERKAIDEETRVLREAIDACSKR